MSRRCLRLSSTVLVWGMLVTLARAQVTGQAPQLDGVGVDEQLDQQLPLDAAFVDQTGARVRLGDFFDGERPVVLVFAYHSCPVLCDMVLKATVDSLSELDWTVGEEFEVVSISIDPDDSPQSSRVQLEKALGDYGRADNADGWHFLTTAREAEIRRVTEAAGFRYIYDEDQQQYGHAAVMMLVTRDGRMARYLYGLRFPPEDVRFGLLEASEGKSISTIEQVLTYCYQYDPQGGKYVVVAENVMKLFGGATALVLGTFLFVLWRRDLFGTRARSDGGAGGDDSNPERRGPGG